MVNGAILFPMKAIQSQEDPMATPQASALQTVPQFLASQPAVGKKKFYQMLADDQLPKYLMGKRILVNPIEVLAALKGSLEK